MSEPPLRVNFSDQEAGSEARDYTPMPTGRYHAVITDVSDEVCGPNSKNEGKPYWNVEFTIQEGTYESRKVWANVMLFPGALYTLAQLLKATGREKPRGNEDYELPPGHEFITEHVIVSVRKQRDTYADPDGSEGLYKNEVKGISAYTEVPVDRPRASTSLLP
jgi:hypothetical protein